MAKLPDVSSIKNQIHADRRLAYKEAAKDIRGHLASPLQRAMDLNSEIGSSAWLTVKTKVFTLINKSFGMLYIYVMVGN